MKDFLLLISGGPQEVKLNIIWAVLFYLYLFYIYLLEYYIYLQLLQPYQQNCLNVVIFFL